MHHHPPSRSRTFLALTVLALLLGGIGIAPAAQAADRGTGFGTWAPLSRTGWHGSMRVGDVHTYCIHPGLPVATDATTDLGVSSNVNGLSAQQLVSINYLVGTYGQTDDPVQAAGVGWAVKAIVDRDTTLHSWGYTGDQLSEAIDYIMRRASPENSVAVQQRAVSYLAEAEAIAVPRVGGAPTLATDADDPRRGSVSVDVDPTATGSLRLDNAVFADTGSAERSDVRGGQTYDIIAPASADARPYTVHVTGSFSVRSAAIRFYSTPGQQESAGPAGPTVFTLSADDAEPRPVRFAPRIETAAHIDDDRFVDQVSVTASEGVWPRHADGSFVVIVATADLYRTGAFPAESDEIPSRLTPVAHLSLRTDPAVGAGTYTTTSDVLPGPGVYTAVWRVDRAAQDADVAPHLAPGFSWRERFASPAQTEQLVPSPPPVAPSPAPSAAGTPTVTPTTAAAPAAPPLPPALAMTGASVASTGGLGGAAAAAIALGVAAWGVTRRRSTPRS